MKEQNQPSKGITRRDFLKGAAVGAAAVAASGALGGCASQANPDMPQEWDREVDVVVVGTGTVAIAAPVAHDAGAEVLVLEKAGVFGGTTAISGGGLWIPNNFLMQEAGLDDSREKALTYMKHVAGGQSDEDLMAAYVDTGDEMLQWLRDNAGFQWLRPEGPASFADYYTYDGAMDDAIARIVYPVPLNETGSGPGLMAYARQAIDEREIEIMFETPGKRLVTDSDGAVIGVIAESAGEEIAIKARQGVILGTGGFAHDEYMRTHFIRIPLQAANSVTTCTGDGHRMGMAVGADLGNMNECWGLPFFKPDPEAFSGIADWQMFRGKPGTVVVNRHGERIGNESSAYDPANKAFYAYDTGTFEWRNIPAFFICDAGYTENYPLPGSQYQVGVVPEWFTEADSLSDLADALGIDADGLAATIEAFNVNAVEGVDPVWHRGESSFDQVTAGDRSREDLANPCLAPLETPPFYGARLWPGTCGTNGGLRTDVNGQVLNVWGETIPGLYATGNTMASVMGVGYPGGGSTVGAGMIFAYLAAQHVAAQEVGEE